MPSWAPAARPTPMALVVVMVVVVVVVVVVVMALTPSFCPTWRPPTPRTVMPVRSVRSAMVVAPPLPSVERPPRIRTWRPCASSSPPA